MQLISLLYPYWFMLIWHVTSTVPATRVRVRPKIALPSTCEGRKYTNASDLPLDNHHTHACLIRRAAETLVIYAGFLNRKLAA